MNTTVVNMRTSQYDARIDRATAWGNPFHIGRDGDRRTVVAKYRRMVEEKSTAQSLWIHRNIESLRGKRLGCWCAPLECHGNVLIELLDSL